MGVRLARKSCPVGRQRQGARQELGLVAQLVHQAEGESLARADEFAAQHQPASGRRVELRADDGDGGARVGNARPHLGEAEATAAVRGHAMVPAEGEDQAAGDRVTVYGTDHRSRERVPAGEQAVDSVDHPALGLGVERGCELEVHARREEPLAAGYDHGSRVGRGQLLHHPGALLEQLQVERVRGRPVDGQQGHVAVLIDP